MLGHWRAIEADLHDVYGIDVDSGILRDRTWRWLKVRIGGLLRPGTRLGAALAPPAPTRRG